MNYYKKLKDLREDNDATQQDIADYLKISRGNYAMYECGSNIIPLDLLDKLSIKYQVSMDYLVGLSKEKTNKKIIPINKQKICERLKAERKEKNLTQRQVADYLGITQSHYSTYESGRNTISITKLIKLAELYKISIDNLTGKN